MARPSRGWLASVAQTIRKWLGLPVHDAAGRGRRSLAWSPGNPGAVAAMLATQTELRAKSRDNARRRNPDVELKLSGTEIELDRAIVDELADPLLHLLRNAIDHGVEPPDERTALGKPSRGIVALSVRRNKDRVVLEVEDDGRGMDPQKLRAAAVERGLRGRARAAPTAQARGRTSLNRSAPAPCRTGPC